jgi:hypothetical protein
MDDRTHPALPLFASGRRAALAALLCVASWLGGCALVEESLNPPEPEPVAVAEPEPLPAVGPPLPPAPRPRPPARVARLPTPAEPPQAQPQPPTQPKPEPEPAAPGDARLEPDPTLLWLPEFKLVGMSRGETATLLGAPTEERDAAPAKIWKFMAGECVIDVYFYLDVARNDFYALHYNVQDRYGVTTGEPAERCLQRIYSESRR